MPSDSLRSGYAVTAVFNGYIEGVLARLWRVSPKKIGVSPPYIYNHTITLAKITFLAKRLQVFARTLATF